MRLNLLAPAPPGSSAPVPDRAPLPLTAAEKRVITMRTWLAVPVVAAVGGVAYGLVSDRPGRAVGSYLIALCFVLLILSLGALNVRMADRIAPSLSLIAAVFSYLITVVALGLALAVSSPRVVDGAAVAVGLLCGLVVWTTGLIARSRVRSRAPQPPVSI